METKEVAELNPIQRLKKDIRDGGGTLGIDEARFLVDLYYALQEQRKRSDNQVRALLDGPEPHATIAYFAKQFETLENQVRSVLDVYSASQPLGVWARSIVGIGPVIASGLLAHIDLEKSPTVGHIWAFGGYDPTKTWEKGQKRPWNASLKTLLWKLGESFVKVSGHEDDIYGKLYLQRKAAEIEANEAGRFADQAAAALTKKKIGKDTDAYKAYSIGKLPPAHIHARAKRWAVKLFLSHYHEMGYKIVLGKPAPLPYSLAMLKHAHKIGPS
jgi:hypothetical protein